jgi:hypothetical protein
MGVYMGVSCVFVCLYVDVCLMYLICLLGRGRRLGRGLRSDFFASCVDRVGLLRLVALHLLRLRGLFALSHRHNCGIVTFVLKPQSFMEDKRQEV